MKKVFALPLLFLALGLNYCTSSKQPAASTGESNKVATVTYLTEIKPIVSSNCGPCHMPPGGSKKPLDTYASVKSEINDIISRIQLNPGEQGFMPARHPKLSEETIQKFRTWRDEGMAEK